MSEELRSLGLTINGISIGNFEYFPTRRTTLNQFQRLGILPKIDYGPYGKRQPDGLVIERDRPRSQPRVIALIEEKQPVEFRSEKQKKVTEQQCNDLCQVCDAVVGIVTDRQSWTWINPKQPDPANKYNDRTTGFGRSYSIIRTEDKKPLAEPFLFQEKSQKNIDKLDESTKNTLYYLERAIKSINSDNSDLITTEEVDPLRLAQAVWQDIYVSTGKSPVKCLYNVVELFIFKFLSDLSILQPPNDFRTVLDICQGGNRGIRDGLKYYARNSRAKIMELFPPGADGTTIINGTIFVDGKGNPVLSQASLFRNSLRKYDEFSSLKNIKREFKTKLFETFLKQSSDKSRLGQFFTPRKVVKAIVDMADVEQLPEGTRLCDPFCGVGGFISETIQKPGRKRDFFPSRTGKIEPRIIYKGFDKGTDQEDERTIILAKANLLIYLSEIVERHPTYTMRFAEQLNDIFELLTESNLGTLKKISQEESEKYDLILTNPPYITKGVKAIREEIKSEGLDNYYNTGAKGVDGLAVEWIIRNLALGGRAFIIVPSGLLIPKQNTILKELILKECHLLAIISLPSRTFFNTPRKTYIIILQKKVNSNVIQTDPVFTYIVSSIGETLDSNRFEIEGKSDLERSKELFNIFKGAPTSFPLNEISDPRCIIQPIDRFNPSESWDICRWWSKEERIEFGIEKKIEKVPLPDYIDIIARQAERLSKQAAELNIIKESILGNIQIGSFRGITIDQVFDPIKGSSKYTKGYMRRNSGRYPVYSSQTANNGVIGCIASYDHEGACITWTTDGIHAGTVFMRSGKFSMTSHCGSLFLKPEFSGQIDLKYIWYLLSQKLKDEAEDYDNKRVTSGKLKKMKLKVPISRSGRYDLKAQKQIADQFDKIERTRQEIVYDVRGISDLMIAYSDASLESD